MIETLKEALFKRTLNEIAEIEAIGPIDTCTSKELDDRIYLLLSTPKKRISHRLVWIAAIIASLIILSITASAIHRALVRHGYTFGEGYAKLSAEADMPQSIEVIYAPSYLPNGFELTSEGVTNHQTKYSKSWENGEKKIEFRQYAINCFSARIDTEHTEATKLTIGDYELTTYTNEASGQNSVYFVYQNYLFSFHCSGIEWSEIEKMVLSVE